MKLTLIAGARPNFVKIAPIIHAIEEAKTENKTLEYSLVHTGQHFDANMSSDFFEQLGIPEPNVNLGAGGGTQAEQTASIMIGFEKYVKENPCDLVLVVGDVTSTLACSIVAKKAGIKVAHVEGGIRSNDCSMPEEINRKVTDSITDYFFTTSHFANENLEKEGISKDRIFFVGNVMIDSLLKNQTKFCEPVFWSAKKLEKTKYFVLTLHRPSNVDDLDRLKLILSAIDYSVQNPVIFPVHPRTRKQVEKLNQSFSNIKLVGPQPYLEFNYLVSNAKGVLTDSGGITEETTVLGIPCVTLRSNTERPETVVYGSNELVGNDLEKLKTCIHQIEHNNWKSSSIPELWDGQTANRIVNKLIELFPNTTLKV
jgi:UDP-N-acetylglucosamine 2-epimerase (non-hydrolysing)